MKTRFTFLTFSIFLAPTLGLALLAPSSALAQTKDGANPPPAAGRGRHVIGDKLERIRLETVSFDGLPQAEVVTMLRDEARKRDPEKKGINFMTTSNLPEETSPVQAPGAPPPEAIDVNSVLIRIRPPLTDVRLVDVLDAVVKVAERPIQYTVEEYGVVISPRGVEPMRKEGVRFTFPGGTPRQFLEAVQQQCQVDWSSVAEIPTEMADAHIPKLRIHPGSVGPSPRVEGAGNDPLAGLVSLYNQLGEQKPELGRLIVKGDLTKPSVVMFVPDKAATDTQPKIKVKAFSIWPITDAEAGKLLEDIERAKGEAMDYASRRGGATGLRALEGRVAIHKETSLLVATGTESFVDMVESIVNACLTKRARNPVSPMALPAAPGK